MSMFHELMMRKKDEIMYATIKGTLTENDGVFSGFSASNYLEVQGLYDCSKSFEVVLKIKTGVSSASGFLRMTNDGYGSLGALAGSGLNIGVWARNTSDRYIANGVYSPSNSVPNNTDKFVKFIFTGTQYIIALSDDGINYTTTNTINNSTNIGTKITIKIGATAGIQYFNGSIDLNRSYIKLGATKYKLQAVVGYTVVGSLTITDGVVSGFSSSNYLKTNGSLTSLENVETVVKFNLSSLISATRRPIGYSSYNTASGCYISSNGTISLSIGKDKNNQSISSVTTSFVCEINTWYYLKVQYKVNDIVVSISTDGFNYTQIGIKENIVVDDVYLTPNRNFGIGTSLSDSGTYSEFTNGSIDLKETYIKKNNKLWFNGQQA